MGYLHSFGTNSKKKIYWYNIIKQNISIYFFVISWQVEENKSRGKHFYQVCTSLLVWAGATRGKKMGT